MPFDGPLGVMMAGGGDTGTQDIFFVNVINPLRKLVPSICFLEIDGVTSRRLYL